MAIISFAIIKLTVIAVLGYFFYKKRLIEEKVFNFLIFFVVNFTIPFMAFSHIIENTASVLKPPLIFILLSVSIFLVSFVLGFIFSFKRGHEFKKEFISLVSFQNCGYLPLNIALFLFPAHLREEFIVYVFLYILGFDIIMWSVGSYFIFRKTGEEFKPKTLLTPPIVGTLIALILVYSNTARFIPGVIAVPMKMVGDTSFVLSMLILGCWLAKIKLEHFFDKLFIILEASFLKLVMLPFLFLLLLIKLDVSSLLGFFVVLQASMPSAVTLPIVVNLRKADSELVSQGVLFTHIFSIITVPLWLGLYMKISGFSF
ncbi:MAG: AEC family transporter [Candidatus Omnitrophica bacterium]|nr:AEC family transporter [Candidatus Omnitrophota bacterium]